MQLSFSRLWDGFATNKEAIQARNKKAKELKTGGHKVKCFRLKNQIKPYDGLGQPNGACCDVYFLDADSIYFYP